MRSDRIQRQIDRLLDQCEEAIARGDWELVRTNARAVLGIDADDRDAQAFLAAADAAITPSTATPAEQMPSAVNVESPAAPLPTSFCEGRYEVQRFLGEGGKKRVYLAHDAKLDRDVAFALIKTDGLDDEGLLRIKREAQAMGRLGDHPHIVSVHDIGDEAGQPYLVSQLMPGGDVEGLVERAEGHRLPLERALEIADQVCRALEHAHSHGIVHRDLKPGNVWLTADGTAKLGDFGLAVALDRSRLTQAGMMVGTVSYMPPEQAMGGEVTARSDLYSLGAMLYEMVTGRPPFVGDESVAIITQHLNTPPVAPSWHAPEVPPGLEALILRLLQKDPAKRPASAAEVKQMLAGVRALSPTPPPTLREGQTSDDGSPLPKLGEGQTSDDGSPLPKLGEGQGVRADNPVYRQAFVGREAELKHLQAIFDAALSGRGALVAVVGEPGIGKTALCEQFATYVAVRGGKTLVGHCYEEGSLSLPYLAFVEAMRAYVLAREPEALKEELGSGAQEVARIVSEIRLRLRLEPLTPHASRLTPSSDPDEDRWRLFDAISSFLRNASSVQPLVIVLEDLHWADHGTLDLLVHLSRNLQGARVVLVGTYRDVEVDRSHPLSAALAELRRVSAFERVLLRGLSIDEVQRMLGAISGQDVSWGFADAVHRQTEGNPLFVQEVIRYLAEEGLIQREGGRWRRAGGTPLEMSIPEGLRDVIGKRLSRLSPECNRILTPAAVIGREFDLAMLQAVAGVSEEAVVDALEEAVRVGILQEETRPGSVHFRFSHAFFRQTLYEELFAPRRLRLHQDVARALEKHYAARLEDHAAELAEHFAQSTDRADLAKAIHYGELAARRAMAVQAYGEAARHLERALQVQEVVDPEDTAKRCDLLLAFGEALSPAGEPQRVAEEVGEEAFALAQALVDRRRTARSCLMAIEAAMRSSGGSTTHVLLRRRWAERLDASAEPNTPERVYAEPHFWNQRWVNLRWAEARAGLESALEAARQLEDPDLLFQLAALAMQAGFMAARHQATALRLADEFTRRPREGVSAASLFNALMMGQGVYLECGQRARAEEIWRELDVLAARVHDPVILLWPLQREALQAVLDGELLGAVDANERLAARSEELGSPIRGRHFANLAEFWPLVYLGRFQEAQETISNQALERQAIGLREGRIGICLAYTGRLAEARSQLRDQVAKRGITAEEDEMFGTILADLLHAAVLVEDHEAAALLTGRLQGVTVVGWAQNGLTNVARPLGRAALLLGDRDGARENYERSLAWATAIRHRPEIALTRLEMAELLLGVAPTPTPPPTLGERRDERAEALVHLDFAIEEFRAMKMQPFLERALRHKGLLPA